MFEVVQSGREEGLLGQLAPWSASGAITITISDLPYMIFTIPRAVSVSSRVLSDGVAGPLTWSPLSPPLPLYIASVFARLSISTMSMATTSIPTLSE